VMSINPSLMRTSPQSQKQQPRSIILYSPPNCLFAQWSWVGALMWVWISKYEDLFGFLCWPRCCYLKRMWNPGQICPLFWLDSMNEGLRNCITWVSPLGLPSHSSTSGRNGNLSLFMCVRQQWVHHPFAMPEFDLNVKGERIRVIIWEIFTPYICQRHLLIKFYMLNISEWHHRRAYMCPFEASGEWWCGWEKRGVGWLAQSFQSG
jgi:hypothetical protein